MSKIASICAGLRDIGVFLIGISFLVISAYLIYERANSPEKDMERAIYQSFTDALKAPSDQSD